MEYKQPTIEQRISATLATTRKAKDVDKAESSRMTFPAPLVLSGDDLANDPKHPRQSLRQWLRLEDRNEVTTEKNVIYVVPPPGEVKFMEGWNQPKIDGPVINKPRFDEVVGYITAFYHGIKVKTLSRTHENLCFTEWADERPRKRTKTKTSTPRYIGLNTSKECIGIRSRPSVDGIYPAQLNLDDLLDAAISILPEDAYALLLLVDHDLYEDDEDLFVCGRAYGGSRVAVVSTARYHPGLDNTQDVERDHAWPASHCELYIENHSKNAEGSSTKKKTKEIPITQSPLAVDSPLNAALKAHVSIPSLTSKSAPSGLTGLWLGRVCRTASHELGHCFGMEHCVYYACSMQGSSSLSEDDRQPPYLCPVDLSKMLHASGASAEERYRVVLRFCERHEGSVHLFSAYAAWIRQHLVTNYL